MKQGISFETNGDEKDIPTYFGKKKKNIDENAACLYVATCAYLNNTNNPKKKPVNLRNTLIEYKT